MIFHFFPKKVWCERKKNKRDGKKERKNQVGECRCVPKKKKLKIKLDKKN